MRVRLVTAVSFAALMASPIFAQEAAPAEPEENAVDLELEGEIAYAAALVDAGYSDFAEPVIEATKKKWPEADARFFAIEIKGLIARDKMEEAEKRIAALPDRKSAKYWGARIELANNYAARNRKQECRDIYDGFFKAYANPSKDILPFYMQACFQWGQILVNDNRIEEAVGVYEKLLKLKLKTSEWCMMACETNDLYIRLADEALDKAAQQKDKKKADELKAQAKELLGKADQLADKVLDHPDQAICFGRGVATKAHVSFLNGDIQEAKSLIEEFEEPLEELHKGIVGYDPDGVKGMRKMSPLPQCRFLFAEMMWKLAQAEFAKPNHDDEVIKSYMFGEIDEETGKRDGNGAYQNALNVFMKYPECAWAMQAKDLADSIENFAKEKYQAKIAKKVTPEVEANIIKAQFRGAQAMIDQGDTEKGIAEYIKVLGQFPEKASSLDALEALCKAYHRCMALEKNEEKINALRMELDAIESYVAERFAGNKDRELMMRAGDTALRIAAMEKEMGQVARASALRRAFAINYRRHTNADGTIAGLAGEAQKGEHWREADELWELLEEHYTNSTYYVTSFFRRSECAKNVGDAAKEREMMKAYVERETKPVQRTQAQLALAQMYQKLGFDAIKEADHIEDPAAQEQAIKAGEKQVKDGIRQFKQFITDIDKLIADPNIPASDKEKYAVTKEQAMFLVADCWCRLKKPEKNLELYRKAAADNLEKYVASYPQGQYAKIAYVRLSMMYTILKDLEKSQAALERLSQNFPDSEEAKNAVPMLARSFAEMGLKQEAAELYEKMLKTDGMYSARQYVDAGDALREARSWDQCTQAYDKALRLITKDELRLQVRARYGKAKAMFVRNQLEAAREEVDRILGDEKMSRMGAATDAYLLKVDICLKQGKTEKDAARRDKHFKAAGGAAKKLRGLTKVKVEADKYDLLLIDIRCERVKSEEEMGQKEAAAEARGEAAAILRAFIQGNGISPEHPFDKMSDAELANLEHCYELIVPLFGKMGGDFSGDVLKYGGEYLQYFPNGKQVSSIQNIMNQARANQPKEKGVQK